MNSTSPNEPQRRESPSASALDVLAIQQEIERCGDRLLESGHVPQALAAFAAVRRTLSKEKLGRILGVAAQLGEPGTALGTDSDVLSSFPALLVELADRFVAGDAGIEADDTYRFAEIVLTQWRSTWALRIPTPLRLDAR